MKNKSLAVAMACFVSLFALTGCRTTYSRLVASSAVTVDKAMKAWSVYVVDGHATPEQRAKVSEALQRYYAAEDAAILAYQLSQQTGDASGWSKAAAALTDNQQLLLNLVATFTGRNAP